MRTFKFLTIILYVFSYESSTAKNNNTLEFWVPDTKYNRKTMHTKKYGKVERFHFRHNGEKINNKSKENILRQRTSRYHSMEADIHEKWPKVHQHKFKQKTRKQQLRSTRMTVVNKLQYTEKNNKHSTEEKVTYELNPYNILNQMERLRSMFPNANITIEVIGRTIEYKDIVLLKITKAKSDVGKYYRATDSKYVDEIPEKKIIFIVHGLAVMGIHDIYCLSNENKFRQLVSYYLSHLDKFDIFLIPMANPDGYSLHSSEPNWNKNSSPLSPCLGVALDRNLDVAWNTSHGISTCSPHYPGSEPFSEAETRAIRDVFHRYSHKIIAYINVHGGSFNHEIFKGDAVLYPKGYTDVQSDDDKYIDLRGEIDEAIRNASFKIMSVTVDSLNNWYGKIQGSSVDYASTVYGIPYALEFVMQPYSYETSNAALVEIWKRLIDVVFINIWKSIHNNDV